MKRVPGVVWFAIRSMYDELFPLSGMGVIWFVMAVVPPLGVFELTRTYLPNNPALGIVLVLLSLIPAPPATAALYYVTSFIAREKRIEFNYFWQGFKTYFWKSWAVAGVLLVTGAILIVDLMFYLRSSNTLFAIVGFLGIWALVLWLAIQVYLFPLMIRQEDKRLRLILKNGSLLTLAYPVFALGILIAIVLFTALSALLVILLPTLWMPLVTLLNNRALVSSLGEVERYQQAQIELDEEREEEQESES
jgi:uncharacterized membrane protein YesL